MQMVWMRLLAPKSPSFTFPAESLKILAPRGEKQNQKPQEMKQQPELKWLQRGEQEGQRQRAGREGALVVLDSASRIPPLLQQQLAKGGGLPSALPDHLTPQVSQEGAMNRRREVILPTCRQQKRASDRSEHQGLSIPAYVTPGF